METAVLCAFIVYFGSLIGIGTYFCTKARSATEFMLGGRSANYIVTAIAAQSSDMGAWLFLAFPATIYSQGLFGCWIAVGLVLFMFLSWHFIAPRLRTKTEELDTLTLSSFFSKHFKDNRGTIRLISALFSLLFFTFYIASGLVGLGRLFESAFELNYQTGVMIGLTTAALYTLIGGFIAVAWCDLVQGIFLLIMILLVPAYAFFSIDGIESIIANAHAKKISLSLLNNVHDIFPALNLMAWGLGYFGQPHVLTYFMGINDTRKIKYAKYIGITWQILVLAAAISIGLIGIAFFSNGLANEELLFVTMTKSLFHPLLVGFILCAILAAILSTLDSQILLSGSVLAEDIYKQFYNKNASTKQIVWITRVGALLICFVSLSIAWSDSATVYDLVSYAWSGLGSSFGPLVILTLYSRTANYYGALSGIVVGGLTSAIWPYLETGIMPIIPGFVFGIITILLVSLATRDQK